MKISTILSFAPLTAALPHVPRSEETLFGVVAREYITNDFLGSLSAVGSKFWLGGESGSCPPDVSIDCNLLGYSPTLASANSLYVSVPGGQNIYVDQDGAIRFTAPNSPEIPAESIDTSYTYTPDSISPGKGQWNVGDGLMACPASKASSRRARRADSGSLYQLYTARIDAVVPTGDIGDCFGIVAIAVATSPSEAAEQYV